MARIRSIKPEFFRHEELFEAEQATGLPLRIAFAGLWTVADREGRFRWRPRVMKLDVMPFDDVDFEEVLSALVTYGFIVQYEVGGETFAHIPKWAKHQHINQREAASELPAPPEDDARTCENIPAHGEGKGREQEGKGAERRASEYDLLESELREAAGLENDPSPGLLDLSPIIALQNAGYSLNADILPKLRAAKAKGRKPKSWAYFVEAVQDGKRANSAIKPKPESRIVAPVVFVAKDDSRWSSLADKWREKHGKEPPAMVSGVGGMGWQFPADWVAEVNLEIPERLKRTQAA